MTKPPATVPPLSLAPRISLLGRSPVLLLGAGLGFGLLTLWTTSVGLVALGATASTRRFSPTGAWAAPSKPWPWPTRSPRP